MLRYILELEAAQAGDEQFTGTVDGGEHPRLIPGEQDQIVRLIGERAQHQTDPLTTTKPSRVTIVPSDADAILIRAL